MRKFIRLASAMTLTTVVIAGISASNANADAGRLEIRNASNSQGYLYVCRDWGSTKCNGGYVGLAPGKSTYATLKWDDADGVRLFSFQKYYVSTNNWTVYKNCGSPTREEKRRGTLGVRGVETWTVYSC